MKIKFNLNGKNVETEAHPLKRLLDILRDDFDLISVKEGCGQGECGTCTVLMDEKRVNACLIPAFQLESVKIVTLEGLKAWKSFVGIERAYLDFGAVQCGYCISGFVMSTAAMLMESQHNVLDTDLKWRFGGNLCRCTGYTKIIQAVNYLQTQHEIKNQLKTDWNHAFK